MKTKSCPTCGGCGIVADQPIHPDLARLLTAAAEAGHITEQELISQSRQAFISEPRFAVAYIGETDFLIRRPMLQAALRFGDISSVSYAIKQAGSRMATQDKRFCKLVGEIRERL